MLGVCQCWKKKHARFGGRLAAGAVGAAVQRTGSANLNELLFERLPGAMHSNRSVSRSDARGLGELFEAGTAEIDGANGFRIALLQAGQGVSNAVADNLAGLPVGCSFCSEIVGPPLQRAIVRGTAPVVIDDCVSQNTVEPSHSGLIAAKLGAMFDGTQVGVL